MDETETTFQIYSVKQAKKFCKLHKKLRKELMKNKFRKVMCPFGILLVATSDYPDELLKYGANIVANLVDNDGDGNADDSNVLNHLAHNGKRKRGTSLVCGKNEQQERKEEKLSALESTFSCQTWKGSNEGMSTLKGIMFEEAFHMIHDMGWARAYPSELGMNDYTSIVCEEMARLQCVKPGWWHQENKCPAGAPFLPGNPAPSPLSPGDGDCTSVDCDCAEYYRQAVTLYTGWYDLDFWYSDYMPTTKEDFMEMSSDKLLNMMADPKYNQPQSPLTGIYARKGMRGTIGKGKGGCKVNCDCNDETDDDGDNDGKMNGEEACEGHGYNENQCESVGDGTCCHYDSSDNVCWSSIGKETCPNA